MDKNFGLSAEEFDLMVADLRKNETAFFKQVFLRHFESCLVFLQKNYQASYDDAYDATMDTLIEFRRLLVEYKLKYGNLRYLFTKMATQIYMRNRRKYSSQELQESDVEPVRPSVEEQDQVTPLINLIWDELHSDCQELLKLHYYGKLKLTEIAEQLGKSPAAVRKQKERCLDRMRTLLQQRQEIIQ